MSNNMPMYDGKYEGRKPGMYLGLFHGFHTEEERAAKQDWGDNGPMIGPLQYAHTTYASEIKLKFISEEDAEQYGIEDDGSLPIDKEGCVVFGDMQYGDWTVFCISQGSIVKGN